MDITDIPQAVERLGLSIEHYEDEVRVWAVAMLASRLGITAVFTSLDGRAEAIGELGAMWADMVREAVEDEPLGSPDALRAAHGVVEQLLRAVPDTQRDVPPTASR